jgi:cytochrome P450
MMESVALLAVLVRRLRFEAVEGYVLDPVHAGVVQKPKGGMPMRVVARR